MKPQTQAEWAAQRAKTKRILRRVKRQLAAEPEHHRFDVTVTELGAMITCILIAQEAVLGRYDRDEATRKRHAVDVDAVTGEGGLCDRICALYNATK